MSLVCVGVEFINIECEWKKKLRVHHRVWQTHRWHVEVLRDGILAVDSEM